MAPRMGKQAASGGEKKPPQFALREVIAVVDTRVKRVTRAAPSRTDQIRAVRQLGTSLSDVATLIFSVLHRYGTDRVNG